MSNFSKIVSNLFSRETEKPVELPVKPRGKELTLNTEKEIDIKIINNSNLFHFDFKVYGRSIFQNLILTASAYNSDNLIIPLKCKWKRVKGDIEIKIKDISSNSYLPTAEDIGFLIEVEAFPIDSIYGEIPAVGQYGPIFLDNDMKNTLEVLLTSGGTKFSCYIYDIIENEKITNKEILLYINTNEIRLAEVDYNGKENILEEVKYHQLNPIIIPHHYDIFRFSIKFFSFEIETSNSLYKMDKIKQIEKSEYNLIAMSKQCRELIYLLFHFFLLDEKIKNSKLFNSMNYNILPQEVKVGVTDLISEIKTLREENNIIMNNMKILDKTNKDLVNEMKDLEQDFQITLETINSQINNNFYSVNNDIKSDNKIITPNNNIPDIKKKYDDLLAQNSLLTSKEKSLREENKELNLNIEIIKNKYNEMSNEMKTYKQRSIEYEMELNSLKKNYNIIIEQKNKLLNEYNNIEKQFNIINNEKEELINKINKDDNLTHNDEYLNKISDFKKQVDTLTYENKNLILQRNVLTNQKDTITKELEKLSKEKNSYDTSLSKLKDENYTLSNILRDKEDLLKNSNYVIETKTRENKDFKIKYDMLEVEYNMIKNSFDSMFINNGTSIQISQDEYEEYDQLKREKDETEAILMQLKSNNDAKDLEIQNLKLLLNKHN